MNFITLYEDEYKQCLDKGFMSFKIMHIKHLPWCLLVLNKTRLGRLGEVAAGSQRRPWVDLSFALCELCVWL